MDMGIATGRPVGCVLAVALMLAAAPAAFAQAPPAPAAAPKPAPAKPAAPAAQKPAPAAPAQAQAAPPADSQTPQLMYSPWIKVCNKAAPETNNKAVCVTAKDGRLENGMPVAAAALIEPEGEPRKIIRITVPLGMQIPHGTRMILDTEPPMTAPYFLCIPNGCMADYDATELLAKMKKGKMLTIQAVNINGAAISLPLPLNDFAKAYDGPPTDPKVLEEQQRKLQEELQKKAEEARKKIEAAPSATAPKQ